MPRITDPDLTSIAATWDSTGDRPYPDLDVNGEREARVNYLRMKGSRASTSGYALCYRCEESASQFVGLRVSSLTPICMAHLEDLTWGKDPRSGDNTEVGPYTPGQ